MLEALGSPSERSILSEQTEAGNRDAGAEENREDGEPPQEGQVAEKREQEVIPGSHRSLHPEEESTEEQAEKRRNEEHEQEPEEDLTKDKKGEPRL